MKILILIDSFGRGGAEKSTALFILKLNQRYKDFNFVCVYLYPFQPGSYEEIEKCNIPLIHLKGDGFFKRVRNFRRILKEHNPDIIHSVLYDANLIKRFASIGIKGLYVESLVNKPYVKEREYQTEIVRYKSKVAKWLDIQTAFLVDHFHSVGHAVANHYKEMYGGNIRYTVVERGRPVPAIDPDLEELRDKKIFTLVTTARQEYQKGLIYLLQAVLLLKGELRLKIIGREGSATPQLQDFVKENGLEDFVTFYGFIENVVEVVSEADLYVSASIYEGLPGSVIEAMSVKKPLLLSDIEEHREVARENENALFFKPKDVEELRAQLQCFIENKVDLNLFGQKSFHIFKKRFTEEAMVEGMANFYKTIFNNTDSGSKI